MIYPSTFEQKTGFDQIRNLVRELCLFDLGRQQVDAMEFTDQFELIHEKLDQAAEFKEICLFEQDFPEDHYYDPTAALRKSKVEGSYMELDELVRFKRSLDTLKAVLHFFRKTPGDKYITLKKLTGEIKYFPYVEERINAILSRQEKIKDNASKELKIIREEITRKNASAAKLLQNLLKYAIRNGLVEKDTAVTIRNSRQVIPVPVSNKRRIGGIIHDESATGRTAYIEPSEVVELNNDIRELEIAEHHEIIKILIAFASAIRPYIDDLILAYQFLGNIDFIRAKALFALRINAGRPALLKDQGFMWKQAVHPLLLIYHSKENKEVVPLSISLDALNRILLISGPNAGGKSVCLQTVGLLQYMLQCGMLVPMTESSEAGIFEDILIDIGDEQSIENDLSTYSSHLLNMKFFLRHASPKSLVLIDEFGAGTEPLIGGAIAEAILESLNQKGTYGVVTTHYANLKYFASSAKGIVNGAMLFDTARLKPIFRLETGEPGSSFAIDIARQIGLPEEILHSASGKAGEDHIRVDRHLREIIRDKRYWENKRSKIRIAEKRLTGILQQYEEELLQMGKLKKEVIQKAKNEAKELLAAANREIEKTIRIIRESQAEKDKTKKTRKHLEDFRKQSLQNDGGDDQIISEKLQAIQKYSNKYNTERKHANAKTETIGEREFRIGDLVRLAGKDTAGEIIDVKGDNLLIAFGESMVSNLTKSSVERIDPADRDLYLSSHAARSQEQAWYISQRKLNFNPEIDIRGKRGNEAVEAVRHFIDDATVVGVSSLRILHGKGNGILKQLVRDYLGSLDIVRSCGDEHVERGGSGITVVQLDF
ncbi:MAG: Smr/MutS family protein [Bacteroidales bacterium]|nr:Smr/MutS family protein [Bacteroidales bacterium]